MSRTKGALGKKPAKCRIKPKIKKSNLGQELKIDIIHRIEISCPWIFNPLMIESKNNLIDSIGRIISEYLEKSNV